MIETIIFDLGKVLVDFDFKIAVRRLGDFGLVNPIKVYNLFRNSELAEKWDKGFMASEEFYETIRKELDLKLNMEELIPIWNEIFAENGKMIALALGLAKKKKVFLLSNTNPWHAEHIRKNFKWIHELHGFVASCDVQMMKPDPKIYHHALKKAKAKPQETFYIDDLEENVKAAQALGIEAHQFETYEKLLREMKKLKIDLPPLKP